MDLGLGQLTDDQLVDLLQAACGELARRDHYVRTAAQQTIVTEAEKLAVMRKELLVAVENVRAEYLHSLGAEVEAEVRAAFQSGSIRLIPVEEETKAIVKATLQAKLNLLDEALQETTTGGADTFYCEIDRKGVRVSCGHREVEYPVAPEYIDQVRQVVEGALRSGHQRF